VGIVTVCYLLNNLPFHGPSQAIAAAVRFAPWLLPSPFQQKQVARLMTAPAQTLTPLTQHELRLQQKSRIKLYEGLSEGLQIAVQVHQSLNEACNCFCVTLFISPFRPVKHKCSRICKCCLREFSTVQMCHTDSLLQVVAAVISAANELNQVHTPPRFVFACV
jgi:hypothetical protein